MFLLLEVDRARLAAARLCEGGLIIRNEQCSIYSFQNASDKTLFWYWRRTLVSDVVSRMASDLKSRDLLALVALAKLVIELGIKCYLLSGEDVAKIISTIEAALAACCENKLLHVKSSPQLLLEAKAEIRSKRSAGTQKTS